MALPAVSLGVSCGSTTIAGAVLFPTIVNWAIWVWVIVSSLMKNAWFPVTLFVMVTPAMLWPCRMTPFPLIDTPEVHVQEPLGITTVSPLAAAFMAAWTSPELQLAAVLTAAFAVAALAIESTKKIRSTRMA